MINEVDEAMEEEMENASRDELLRINARLETIIAELGAENARLQAENAWLVDEDAELRELVAKLQQQVAELEAKLKSPLSKAVPEFVKPNHKKRKKEGPRKKRAENFARKRDEPTKQIEHAIEFCTECGCKLFGGTVKHTRQVLNIPIVPVEVNEHIYLERECPQCGKVNLPKVDLTDEVVGKSRVSIQTMAMVAAMREVGRLPIRTIKWHLGTFHLLELSVGEIARILRVVSDRAKGMRDMLIGELRSSPVVHGDETSWREAGQNGYLWTFSNPNVRYFEYRKSRSGEIVTEVLGEDFDGVLVSDFYGGYSRMMGRHQRCWAHLLRDVHELKEKWLNDTELEEWAKGMNDLYDRATDWVAAHEDAEEVERVAAQRGFEGELMGLCRPYLKSERPQRVLCERVEKFLPELFVFVADPRVPPTNNAAERALRPVVISRKISGGTQTRVGSKTKDTLASAFGTWMVQGLNPFMACRALLTTSPPA